MFYFTLSVNEYAHHNVESTEKLLAFVASMPCLSNFELEVDRADPHWTAPYNGAKQISESVCPTITSFHLRILQLHKFHMLKPRLLPQQSYGNQDKQWYIAELLKALHMPHMEDLAISIDIHNIGESLSEIERTDLLGSLSLAVLPIHIADSFACPNLSSLKYKITCNANREDTSKQHIPLRTLPVTFTYPPLDRIPTISTLTITTCTRMCFNREGELGRANGDEKSYSGRLRDVQFLGCEVMKNADFQTAIQSLRGDEAWETIERVVVEYCPSLDYDAALEVVGKEKLRNSSHSTNPTLRHLTDASSVSKKQSRPVTAIDEGELSSTDSDGDTPFKVPEKMGRRIKPNLRAHGCASSCFRHLIDSVLYMTTMTIVPKGR